MEIIGKCCYFLVGSVGSLKALDWRNILVGSERDKFRGGEENEGHLVFTLSVFLHVIGLLFYRYARFHNFICNIITVSYTCRNRSEGLGCFFFYFLFSFHSLLKLKVCFLCYIFLIMAITKKSRWQMELMCFFSLCDNSKWDNNDMIQLRERLNVVVIYLG